MKILIVNSSGHWLNGWMTSENSQAYVVNTLKNVGCEVKIVEVDSPQSLEYVLKNTRKDTLVWANAYWVKGENGAEVGLIKEVEKHKLPMIGSNLQTLNLLLEKDRCQQKLEMFGVSIPLHILIQNGSLENVEDRIIQSQIAFPLVIKPTKESRSHGVTKVENMDEAIQAIHTISKDYPHSNIIVEEFLPTDDITCGYIRLGNEIIILPSFNEVRGMDCSKEVFGERHYKLPPDYEKQVIIEDEDILHQLETTLPKIANILGIKGVTRIDGRLDAQGTLKVFDVNGLPGLNYPISALIRQCFVHFPSYSEDYVFKCLINTIVLENLKQNNMDIPSMMQDNHLFNLKSDTIIKIKEKRRKHVAVKLP